MYTIDHDYNKELTIIHKYLTHAKPGLHFQETFNYNIYNFIITHCTVSKTINIFYIL